MFLEVTKYQLYKLKQSPKRRGNVYQISNRGSQLPPTPQCVPTMKSTPHSLEIMGKRPQKYWKQFIIRFMACATSARPRVALSIRPPMETPEGQ